MAGRDDPKLLSLRGPSGHELFGLVEGPTDRPDAKWLVMSHCGLMGRAGDHRMSVRLARRLLDAGFPVSRFDPHAFGISEGEIPAMTQREVFALVERGEVASDLVAWIDHLSSSYGASRFALVGACGAAMTCMLAAEQRPQVEEVIAISGPVILDATDPVVLNDLYVRAFGSLVATGRRLMLVYATTDHFWTEFTDLFATPHADMIERAGDRVAIVAMERGNHMFSLREWQEEINEKILAWLR